ncbi:MAG: hypothetical protein Q9219_005841 [cf. Caloplaca sp. 3 TL-2023]
MSKRKREEDHSLQPDSHENKRPTGSSVPSPTDVSFPPYKLTATNGSTKTTNKEYRQATVKQTRRLAKREARRQRRQEVVEQQEPRPDGVVEESITGRRSDPPAATQKKDELRRQVGRENRLDHSTNSKAQAKHNSGEGETVKKRDSSPAWDLSEAIGGQMLDLDPLFSLNEEFLLIAYGISINIYSTKTSLLVRKLRVIYGDRVSAFAFSPTDSSHLYVATRSGSIQLWDWFEGRRLSLWFTRSRIYALTVAKPGSENDGVETAYTIDRKTPGPWRICAHRLEIEQESKKVEAIILRKSQEPITAFRIVEDGKVIVATSGSVLTLGTTKQPEHTSINDRTYTWRDIECPEWISSIDIRTVESNRYPQEKQANKDTREIRTDIVVGGLKGSLHVYSDLLNQLIRREKKANRGPTLETGGDTTLPHLGSSLDAIVVSPSGSSYAIRLSDNSAMILSTAELKPTFSVAGTQLTAETDPELQLPYLPNVDVPRRKLASSRRFQFPIVSGPQGLLCAVPAATSSRVPSVSPQHASYLQIFDITSAHQISRQALTRTKATDLNIGPELNTIEEPNVVFMQISSDGQWLATIDEWVPPMRDLAIITYAQEQSPKVMQARKEVYLKFWSWNNSDQVWELVSRIDDPQASDSSDTDRDHRILDLASSPTSNSFATVNDCGHVRLWTPVARQRHGSTVKNRHGQKLMSWHCRSIIALDHETLSPHVFTEAKLAYSPDGSCLAAACSASSPWTIHLIDTHNGTVRTGPYGPLTGSIRGLGIIDRYMVVLSDQLLVWDLISQKVTHGFTLTSRHSLSSPQSHESCLAFDVEGGTFAVALEEEETSVLKSGPANLVSEIIIFEPGLCTPIFVQRLPQPTAALVATYNRRGYVVVDPAAEIWHLTPRQARLDPDIALPSPPQTPSRGLQNIYGMPNEEDHLRAEEARKHFSENMSGLSIEPRPDDDESIVVPQERLTEALDAGPAYAMSSVTDMFERVALLFAGKREP